MATDTLLPLYEILVEDIFGGVGMAIIGMAIIMAIMLMLGRTSKVFLVYWILFYLIIMGVLYFGALALVFVFILTGGYFFYNIIRLFFRDG